MGDESPVASSALASTGRERGLVSCHGRCSQLRHARLGAATEPSRRGELNEIFSAFFGAVLSPQVRDAQGLGGWTW